MNHTNLSVKTIINTLSDIRFFARMMNFFKWWLGFTGLISATSICPFCGQPGCPVGVGVASTMGGFFALFMQSRRRAVWII